MLTCSVSGCGVDHKPLLAILDNGRERIVLCPSHQLQYMCGGVPLSQIKSFRSLMEQHECEICCSPAILYADEVELHLCERHLHKLIARTLTPIEYQLLREKHGEFTLIQSDYYSKGGYRLQPVSIAPQIAPQVETPLL